MWSKCTKCWLVGGLGNLQFSFMDVFAFWIISSWCKPRPCQLCEIWKQITTALGYSGSDEILRISIWDWCRKSNKFNSIALVRQCPMQSLPCDCVVVKASCETSQVTGRSVLGGCWPTNWVGPSRKGGSSWTACTLRRESMLRFLGEVLLLLSCLKRASVDLQSA